jgi:hypothetical protein
MAIGFFYDFDESLLSKTELPRSAKIKDLFWVKRKIPRMTNPLNSSCLGSRGFLLLCGRQQSQLPLEIVNLGQLKRYHSNSLPPLRNPD